MLLDLTPWYKFIFMFDLFRLGEAAELKLATLKAYSDAISSKIQQDTESQRPEVSKDKASETEGKVAEPYHGRKSRKQSHNLIEQETNQSINKGDRSLASLSKESAGEKHPINEKAPIESAQTSVDTDSSVEKMDTEGKINPHKSTSARVEGTSNPGIEASSIQLKSHRKIKPTHSLSGESEQGDKGENKDNLHLEELQENDTHLKESSNEVCSYYTIIQSIDRMAFFP